MPLHRLFKSLIARGEAIEAHSKRQSLELRVASDTAAQQWEPKYRIYFVMCDSPAEHAFLKALIESYGLEPDNFGLKGGGVILDLQVKIERYRVDFMADKWLAIEIDGATYHASADAVRKDLDRDEDIRKAGLHILRIPAKVVFDTPDEAVRRVRSALASKPTPSPVWPGKKFSLMGALNAAGQALEDVTDHMTLARAREGGALRGPEEIFYLEKSVIQKAIESASRQIGAAHYRGQSADHAKWYDAANSSKETASAAGQTIPLFAPPPADPDEKRRDYIERGFAILIKQRSNYFDEMRVKLRKDDRLAALVRAALHNDGHSTVWAAIAP